jgi:uncharacterized protein involved in outer membrane biogenesis
MALSKKAKIWIIILSIPVILLLGAGIALKLYFNGERLKSMIIPRMEEQLHKSVAIRDISFTIFPTLGVTIDGLEITNPPGSGFSRNQFASFDRLEVAVKAMPLIAGRAEVDRILIDHPQIFLEVTAEGKKNYSAGPGKETDTVRITNSGKATSTFILANFEIRNGEFEYINRREDSKMFLGGINQTASASALTGESNLTIHTKATIDRLSYGTLATTFVENLRASGEGDIVVDGGKDAVIFDAIALRVNEIPMKLTGGITELTKIPFVSIDITASGVPMSEVLSLIPPEKLKAAAGLKSSGTADFAMSVRGEMSDSVGFASKGLFTLRNGTIQYASLPKSISNIELHGSFEKPGAPIGAKGIGSFALDRFSATMGTSTLSGSLNVANFDDPSMTAKIEGAMNLNEVKEFYPLEQGTELSGQMKSAIAIQGKPKTPSTIRGDGSIEFQNVTIKTAGSPNPLKNLKGTIAFNNETIQSKSLAMNIGESDLALGFTMRNYIGMVMKDTSKGKRPSATFALTSNQLRMADLMPEEQPPAAMKEPKQPSAKKGSLLPGMDIDGTVSIDRLVTEKFVFTNARGAVGVANGIVNLKNVTVNAFDGTIKSKGTLDMRDPEKLPFNLDLDIQNAQSNTLLSKFTSFGNYLNGRFSVTTALKGDLNDTLGFDQKTLIGEGAVKFNEGKIDGLPLAAGLAAFTGLEELRVINFKDWTNKFSVSNGRVNIRDLNIDAGATDLAVNGSQGLDGSMDYTMNVKLPGTVTDRLKLPGAASQLLQFFKDPDGRISLSFLVGGMATSPSLKLDTAPQEAMAKKAIEQKLTDEKKKLEEGLMKKGEDALKKFLKRP